MYKTLYERMLCSQNDWSSFNTNYAYLIWSAWYKVTNAFIPLEIDFSDKNTPPECYERIKIYLKLIFLTYKCKYRKKNVNEKDKLLSCLIIGTNTLALK